MRSLSAFKYVPYTLLVRARKPNASIEEGEGAEMMEIFFKNESVQLPK